MSAPVLDLAALEGAGRELGATLPTGSVVWLQGDLGAGKTTLTRAILIGRGVTTPGASPTYALVHHHEGPRGSVYHLDCYRLRHPDQAADLDWETLATADLLLIEWPERAGAWAPPPTHRIHLGHVDEHTRSMEVT
ncbi:MAG: tRNA (adenosine(37)-N6)-threonylcarbamoyltransferase complex ATPase subunit type 1 TsaE [Gemmatimonadetes bacterium]|nr:tRNA (adenosine(37)-N6)-threonylcarbamoyltransferase complex ATPase subunit type 1 TsaE [Gemmatimonadota bacterium]MBL0177890.1 tRNA (adenosine(37)-N6)-threonylcarbamoyltransferase complex ATPase subunit type 1 TsaE [Gemmatimonadota bacterium]